MIERHITGDVKAALADTPVVLLHGPRQSGKSTLVQWLCDHGHKATYYSLDDAAVLAAVTRDPDGFLRGTAGPIVIDEIQLVPDLLRAIKIEVDRKRRPGRFLLTGSANILMVPKVSESLAGRMEILSLAPFSVGELIGVREGFVDFVCHGGDTPTLAGPPESWRELVYRMVVGGYPEITRRMDPGRRHSWFGAYLTTILQRDIRQMAEIAGLTDLPRLLAVLAAQSGGLLNMAELSRDIGISQPTMKRYLTLLAATHLYQPLSAWAGNFRKRLIKSPKVYLNDTGLLAYLLGVDTDQLSASSSKTGTILEAFVCQEIRKQISWSRAKPLLYYYRTPTNREVDFVLEHRNGQIVGIEVKAAVKLKSEDLKGLEDLADSAGKKFHRGVILYGGTEVVPFSPKLVALPISALWQVAARA